MQKIKQINCPCRYYKCPRHSDCEACIEHHKNKKVPPSCMKATPPTKNGNS